MGLLGGVMMCCAVVWAALGAIACWSASWKGGAAFTSTVMEAVLFAWVPAGVAFYHGHRMLRGADLRANLRPCPACVEPIHRAAVVCRHCGRSFPPALPR